MNRLISIHFEIAAAKEYHDQDPVTGEQIPDWKVLDNADNGAEAVEKFNSIRDYPIQEFHCIMTYEYVSGSGYRDPQPAAKSREVMDLLNGGIRRQVQNKLPNCDQMVWEDENEPNPLGIPVNG